ncbi:unnamed protein product, partial [Boreogadus saida]
MVAGITMHVSVAPPCGSLRAHAYYQPVIGGFLECGIHLLYWRSTSEKSQAILSDR